MSTSAWRYSALLFVLLIGSSGCVVQEQSSPSVAPAPANEEGGSSSLKTPFQFPAQLHPLSPSPAKHLAELNCPGGHEHLELKQGHELRCVGDDKVAHGPFVVLNRPGQVVLRGEYSRGERRGAFTSYWEDGSIQQQGYFQDWSPAQRNPQKAEAEERLLLPNGEVWISRSPQGQLQIAGASDPAGGHFPQMLALSRAHAVDHLEVLQKPQGVLGSSSLDAAQKFMNLLQTQGPTRVIVGLRVDVKPEGKLSREKVQIQRSAISSQQSGRLSRLGKAADDPAVSTYTTLPYLALEIDATSLAELLLDPEVVQIVPDRLSRPLLNTSTPHIGATGLWAEGIDGSGVAVAVLDTGVEADHAFLSGKVVAEACFSTSYAQHGAESLCPNGQNSQQGEGSGADCDSSIDGCGHGTHVAGIAAGGSSTLDGVAKGADIIGVQVFSKFGDPDDCRSSAPCVLSYSHDQLSALEWVYQQRNELNIAAVNMSLGGEEYEEHCDASSALTAAIENLRSVGIATVIASGNEGMNGKIASPGCISSAVTVGSTTTNDLISSFSNHSPLVDLLAPGDAVLSSHLGGTYVTMGGTSMAAPHVAGAFALLRQGLPEADVDTFVAALSSTGKPISRQDVSVPRIQVDEAMGSLLEMSAPAFDPPGGTFSGSITVTLHTTTPGARIRYTTDGSQPSLSKGTEIASGETVLITSSTVLTAVTVHNFLGLSEAVSATYTKSHHLELSLGPVEALQAGGAWRIAGPQTFTFDDALHNSFGFYASPLGAWSTGEPAEGAVSGQNAIKGQPASDSPDYDEDYPFSILSSEWFETDGGTFSFMYRNENLMYSDLSLFMRTPDSDFEPVFEDIRPNTPWTEFSLELEPGSYQMVWLFYQYTPYASGQIWLDDITVPGDRWRAQEPDDNHVGPLPAGEYPVVFKELPSWKTPELVADLAEGDFEDAVNYLGLGRLRVVIEPQEALEAGAGWRLQGDQDPSWLSSGDEKELPTGSHVVEFKADEAWTAPDPLPVSIDFDDTTEKTATFSQRSAPEPVFSLDEGIFTSAMEAGLSAAAENATIRFTLNTDETVDENSQLYTSPIPLPLNSETTITARTFIEGYLPSAQVSASYRITGKLAIPTSSHSTGEVPAGTLVALSSEAGSTLRYTLDGSPVNESSTLYSSAIEIPADAIIQIRARAFRQDWLPSDELMVTLIGVEESGDDGDSDGSGDSGDDSNSDPESSTDDGSSPEDEAETELWIFSCSSTGGEGFAPMLSLILLLALGFRRRI